MFERLIINVVAVAGTLAITYAPIVYVAHALQTIPGVTA